MQTGAKRLVAIKTLIRDIQSSTQVSEPGGPTGLLLPKGITAHRVNIIGAVVSGPEIGESSAAAVIDDGTGSLVVRTFESPQRFAGIRAGDIITVIGRPRQSSQGMFIAPEIVKTTAPGWIAVRKKEIETLSSRPVELNDRMQTEKAIAGKTKEAGIQQDSAKRFIGAGEETVVIEESFDASPERRICELIRKHDRGDGADAAKVIADSGIGNADTILEKLLKNGDIFAVGPGRYKALD